MRNKTYHIAHCKKVDRLLLVFFDPTGKRGQEECGPNEMQILCILDSSLHREVSRVSGKDGIPSIAIINIVGGKEKCH
ncbi:hypothetical protein TNCV_2231571 [Trichonephila clavipes]|nr:hypothetical protein TNCV_2231571 [Trichonephila clavipes]